MDKSPMTHTHPTSAPSALAERFPELDPPACALLANLLTALGQVRRLPQVLALRAAGTHRDKLHRAIIVGIDSALVVRYFIDDEPILCLPANLPQFPLADPAALRSEILWRLMTSPGGIASGTMIDALMPGTGMADRPAATAVLRAVARLIRDGMVVDEVKVLPVRRAKGACEFEFWRLVSQAG